MACYSSSSVAYKLKIIFFIFQKSILKHISNRRDICILHVMSLDVGNWYQNAKCRLFPIYFNIENEFYFFKSTLKTINYWRIVHDGGIAC